MQTVSVSVIGGAVASDSERTIAVELGRLLARGGYTVVCGGGSGVMEAVCSGAASEGGRTIGILPGEDASAANPYVDIRIPTGMGTSRNRIVVLSGRVVIAVGGGYGTLSEVAFALQAGIPVCAIGRWSTIEGVTEVRTPTQAVEFVMSHTGGDPC